MLCSWHGNTWTIPKRVPWLVRSTFHCEYLVQFIVWVSIYAARFFLHVRCLPACPNVCTSLSPFQCNFSRLSREIEPFKSNFSYCSLINVSRESLETSLYYHLNKTWQKSRFEVLAEKKWGIIDVWYNTSSLDHSFKW